MDICYFLAHCDLSMDEITDALPVDTLSLPTITLSAIPL